MSEEEDYGIFDYLGDKLSKKMVKMQRKLQNFKQSQPQVPEVVTNSQENQTPLSVPQPANPPMNQTVQQTAPPSATEPNNPILSGQLVRNIRQKVSSFQVQTTPVQKENVQEMDTSQPSPRRRFFEQPAPLTPEQKIAAKQLKKAKLMEKGMSLDI